MTNVVAADDDLFVAYHVDITCLYYKNLYVSVYILSHYEYIKQN